jgi:2-hydroxymuconate-semialdehyde hydrolase
VKRDQLEAALLAFVTDELLDGDGRDLTTRTPLLELGIIDSLSIVSLLTHLEQQCGASIAPEQVRPEHFLNIQAIAAFVEAQRKESGDD